MVNPHLRQTSSVESGESEDVLETTYNDGEVNIGLKLNSAYLLDFCKVIGNEGEFSIRLKDGSSACLLEPENQTQAYIIASASA